MGLRRPTRVLRLSALPAEDVLVVDAMLSGRGAEVWWVGTLTPATDATAPAVLGRVATCWGRGKEGEVAA